MDKLQNERPVGASLPPLGLSNKALGGMCNASYKILSWDA